MRSSRQNVFLVGAYTLAAQLTGMASQFVFAALFGVSVETDAFFAALALPVYVTTVLVSSIPFVFVPVFVDRRNRGGPAEAHRIASAAINAMALTLGAIAIAGIAFADPLLGLSAPGLSADAHQAAREFSVILWPSVLGSGLALILTALWQMESKFGWSAAVPFVGAAVNLVFTLLLGAQFGISGAAIAWTISTLTQATLLAPIAVRMWRPSFGVGSDLRSIFGVAAPLILANVLIKSSPVVERFLASGLGPGVLSHVSYASRVVATLAVVVSAGPGAVLFPRLAEDAAASDYRGLGSRILRSSLWLWLFVAPTAALLAALADPGARIVFEHGAFTRADSEAVASLIRAYVPSLVAAAFATITGRAIFALRKTRLLAIVGAAESLAYVGYTPLLADRFGALGIAVGFSLYYSFSLAWQITYLRVSLGGRGRHALVVFGAIGAAAALAGVVAWLTSRVAESQLMAVALGGSVGLAAYGIGLLAMRTAGISVGERSVLTR